MAHLLSPKAHAFLNSSYGNLAVQRRAQGEASLVIHPDDAGPRDIGDGQRVRVFNDRGSIVAGAVVSDDVRPGVVLTNMGHWRKLSLAESTVNAIDAPAFADLGHAPTFSDTLVQVEPVS